MGTVLGFPSLHQPPELTESTRQLHESIERVLTNDNEVVFHQYPEPASTEAYHDIDDESWEGVIKGHFLLHVAMAISTAGVIVILALWYQHYGFLFS